MTQILGFRTELRLNNRQRTLMAKHAGYARWIYNWGLTLWQKAYKDGLKPNAYILKKLYTNYVKPQFKWQSEISSRVYQYAFQDLDLAYKRFFKGTGYPNYKKKGKDDSFTIDAGGKPIKISGTRIKLPFIGWISTHEGLPECETKKVTISRQADRWFISFAFNDEDRKIPVKQNSVVGVDLGVKQLATLSTGQIIEGAKSYRKYEAKLARLQWLNRNKQRSSANWKKAMRQIARLHKKIADIRKDTLHKLTSLLAKNHGVIVIEDLNVRGMMANRKLAKAIADMGFFEFRRQLTYKCELYGSKLVVADRWFASSKLCSNCGCKKEKLTLSERIYECQHCSNVIDRDLNAAINLRHFGLGGSHQAENAVSELAVGQTVLACGLDKADFTSMKQEVNIIGNYE